MTLVFPILEMRRIELKSCLCLGGMVMLSTKGAVIPCLGGRGNSCKCKMQVYRLVKRRLAGW